VSAVGVNGAFVAVNSSKEIGSPGNSKTVLNLSVNSSSELVSSFKLMAYPVPSNTTFHFELTTMSTDDVEIKAYDMNGKLVEFIKCNSSEVNNQSIGNNYSKGIYIIIVSQGKSIKTLRLIKS
jgi:hypothetical protein